jgi:hypothetical protein
VNEWLRAVKLAGRARVEALRADWTSSRTIDTVLADMHEAPRVSAAWALANDDPRWRKLVETFALTAPEAQFLALLCAAQAEPGWRRVLGYLDDDTRPADPTPAAAAALFGWPRGETPAPSGALVRWELATPHVAQWLPTTPWAADPDIVAYLFERDGWATFWPGVERAAAEHDELYPDTLRDMERAARALSHAELELVGPVGSGRRTLLRALCAALGREPLTITAAAPPVKALRTARLLNAIPVWVDAESVADGRDLSLAARTARDPRQSSLARMTFTLPELTSAQRSSLWRNLTAAVAPRAVTDWGLTPAELATAASAAPAGGAAITAVSRRRLGGVGSTLMTRVDAAYGWDDLVVADSVMEQLRELETQVRNGAAVLDDWGFRRLTPRSRGVTALFGGPSGTGKTMAAQVLARALDLDLYQVDLAEVVNKYIGETEKRLAQVFDECERGNVMVLFDEADALFGQRTRVRDAHDRFANIEIDYLLQRMESFDGLAILATNRRGDLDPGFVRRIRMIVDFLAPTVPERHRLWELAVPVHAPSGEPIANGIDRAWLAEELPLTGAEIKSVALAAAFRAHGAGELIGTEHVLAAARRELAKKGTVVRR